MPSARRHVTVVVVNLNRKELLRGAMNSLVLQTGVDFEAVVVDNGSADGSPGMVLEEFVEGGPFPCRLIVNRENRGFCEANNQGIAASNSDYVALLNNDAEAAPEWLRGLLSAFEGRPDVGMAASKILVWRAGDATGPERIDKAGHLIYPDGQNRGRGTGEPDCGQYDREEEALWPDGCAAMYRRAMLDEIGGFDEDFFAYADDAELGLRARIAGWGCMYVPDAVAWHRRAATLGLGSARRLELIERNRVLLVAKHFPARMLWLSVPYYALRLAAGIWAAARSRGETARFPGAPGKLRMAAAMIHGDWAALRMLPAMWRKRKMLRPLRRLTPAAISALLRRYRIPLRTLSERAN